MGYRILLPRGQGCCGLPLFFHGDTDRAKPFLINNLSRLNHSGCDAILTDCATCGSALGHIYPKIAAEFGFGVDRVREMAAKVHDAGEFVARKFKLLEPHLGSKASLGTTTCHLPCHLKNHGTEKSLLEDLLQRLPHVTYARTPDWDSCCGGGGFFFNEYPQIAKKMVDKKIENARRSGADWWVTGCPGCRVQLAGNLPDEEQIGVCHPLEIVAKGVAKDAY